MQLTRIAVENFLGVHALDLAIQRPILLVAGANGAGKSSIQEAVRLAMSGETVRVGLKKEYPLMLTDGGKIGLVEVHALVDGKERAFGMMLPDGKRFGDAPPDGDAVRCVLHAQNFAALDPDSRRRFLFDLTGLKADGAAVRARLEARKFAKERIDAVIPMLRSGFPAASESAARRATESKGAWRVLTGETYGSKKADGWTIPDAPVASTEEATAAAKTLCETTAQAYATVNTEKGASDQRKTARADALAKSEKLKTAATNLPKLPKNLEIAEGQLAELLPKVEALRTRAGGKKREGLVHDLARALYGMLMRPEQDGKVVQPGGDPDIDSANHALNAYEEEFGSISAAAKPDPEAVTNLPEFEKSLGVAQSAVANLKRDLAAAQTAAAALKALDIPPEVTAEEAESLANRLGQAKAAQAQAEAAYTQLQARARAAAEAAGKVEKAGKYHAEVVAWTEIAEALAPEGIPGEMLSEALAPLNEAFMESAEATEWAVARIGADMAVTAGGRSYNLLSESEKWRTDAMIAAAISKLSGIKLLVLDRMDVLDLPGRSACLTWLDQMVDAGEVDTALVFATLKAIPGRLPESFQSTWLNHGHVETFKEAA